MGILFFQIVAGGEHLNLHRKSPHVQGSREVKFLDGFLWSSLSLLLSGLCLVNKLEDNARRMNSGRLGAQEQCPEVGNPLPLLRA